MMKLLILGGTIFLGRHLVEAALASGHTVTIFNRGQHNADLFSQLERLRGDRNGDLEALKNRQWDAVIDTCGYVPRIVRASAEILRDAVDRYVFVSSISVYADFSKVGLDESDVVGKLQDETIEQITGETYGPLKALCEEAVLGIFHGRALIIRPGLIVGPHDPTDRFTYWPRRIARGGEVLAPSSPHRAVQIIDVRDLSEWTLQLVETYDTGIYNATGPDYSLTMEHLLEECGTVSKSRAHLVWVDESFLLEQNVKPWTEIPLWVPDTLENQGFSSVSIDRAMKLGLRFRPLRATIRDTLEWDKTRPQNTELRAGLAHEREQSLLNSWKKRTAP